MLILFFATFSQTFFLIDYKEGLVVHIGVKKWICMKSSIFIGNFYD